MEPSEIDALGKSVRLGPKPTVSGTGGAVVTSHPLAVRAGMEVLREGGNAVDAALAAAATQLIVEPHMTSITGGLSLLYRNAAGGSWYLNGNVHAPRAPLVSFSGEDLSGARGVPVPGWWPAFEAAREQFGTRTAERLWQPAIQIARHGYPVSAFMHGIMYSAQARLGANADMRKVFFPEGHLLEQGEIVIQEQAACTLERLVAEGRDYYYGDFTDAFVKTVQTHGGLITREDLEQAMPLWSEPLEGTYRDYGLITSTPPDDGGAQLIQALNILENFDLQGMGHPSESPETLKLLISAHMEVYYSGALLTAEGAEAERIRSLLSKKYALDRTRVMGLRAPATPKDTATPGTIHISVVDGDGNIASITHSHMADGWVNGLFVEGFQLSGGGSFFRRGMPEPGQKVSVYLTPHIFTRDNEPVLVGGSPSMSIVACVLQNVVNILDFGLPIGESIAKPRFGARLHDIQRGWLPGFTIEGGFSDEVADEILAWAAQKRIHATRVSPWYPICGNYEGITIDGKRLTTSAEPRRVGAAEVLSEQ